MLEYDQEEEWTEVCQVPVAKSAIYEEGSFVGKRGQVKLPCAASECPDTVLTWHCGTCLKVLFYGFDDHFYCPCGRAPVESYQFNCGGHRFLPYDKPVLASLLASLEAAPEYTLLLLGESGCGKSTTINALANYLKFASFEDAARGEFTQLIPSKFMIPHPETGEPFVIDTGSDPNENTVEGESKTISPQTYCFQLGEAVVRIIDTPGVGDTRGVAKDKENFERILNHLNNYEQLDGFLVLMKSNETRKTVTFRYCISELLTHLHKSASKNIIFCFTFSRNSFYGPGEGFFNLNNFLEKDLKLDSLKLDKDRNCFFIDNEAFRFIAAKKQGYVFPDYLERSYRESWLKSVEQTSKMMECVMNLEPHQLKDTTSLNNARRIIVKLAEPMVRLGLNIDANIRHLEEKKENLQNSNASKQELARSLHVEIDDLVKETLDYPTTVCTSSGCVTVITVQEATKTNYRTRCHERCQLSDVATNKIGHPELAKCWAMNGQPTCRQCGCPWQKHMHITCVYREVKQTIIDGNVQSQIRTKEEAIRSIENAIRDMEVLVNELTGELGVIRDVTCNFAYILHKYANTPYNRFIDPYLDMMIDEEQNKMTYSKYYDGKRLNSLKDMKLNYRNMMEIVEKAIENKERSEISLEDIAKYQNELLQLKHSGKQFRQFLDTDELLKMQYLSLSEKPVYMDTDNVNAFTKIISGTKRKVTSVVRKGYNYLAGKETGKIKEKKVSNKKI